MSKFTNYKPDYIVRPSEAIIDLTESFGWSVEELAQKTHLNQAVVNDILNGKKSINIQIAKKLAKAFNVKAEFFLNLQKLYEEAIFYQTNITNEILTQKETELIIS